jgi:hypothetical protein
MKKKTEKLFTPYQVVSATKPTNQPAAAADQTGTNGEPVLETLAVAGAGTVITTSTERGGES